jgi:hypothetical protein
VGVIGIHVNPYPPYSAGGEGFSASIDTLCVLPAGGLESTD